MLQESFTCVPWSVRKTGLVPADQGCVSCPDRTASVSVSLATLEARNDTECAMCAHI